MSRNQIVKGWERDCKRMLVAEGLLTRLIEDDYATLAESEFTPMGSRRWALHWRYLEQQDLNMLGRIIGKYMTQWWD